MSTSEEKAAEAKKRIAAKKNKEIDLSGADLGQLSSLDEDMVVDLSGADLSQVSHLSFKDVKEEVAEDKRDVSKPDLSPMQKQAFVDRAKKGR